MKTKATMRYHLTLVRINKTKISIGESVDKRKHSFTAGGIMEEEPGGEIGWG